MPWREAHVPEQRVLLIAEHLRGERSLKDIAGHFGVSRKTAYKWIERFKSTGLLEERSRRPLSSPSSTSSMTVEILVATRRAHPTWARASSSRPSLVFPRIKVWCGQRRARQATFGNAKDSSSHVVVVVASQASGGLVWQPLRQTTPGDLAPAADRSIHLRHRTEL
jgi:transposase-like protein